MSLWTGLRLVAVDLETCRAPDGTDRVVSVGLAGRRRTGRASAWEHWVNPGVPIDARTSSVHHLVDADVADEPAFADLVPDILRQLAGREGETVVLVAHNAPFDIPILRDEFARAEADLPDFPVLDTMLGLRTLAGIESGSASLESLLSDLGLSALGDAHHGALVDASACADAAVILLDTIETDGCADLETLLTAAGGQRVTTVPRRTISDRDDRVLPVVADLPPDHIAAHADFDDYAALLEECAALRCDRITDVAERLPAEVVRPALFATFAAASAARDATGANTALHGLTALLGTLPGSAKQMRAEIPDLTTIRFGRTGERGVATSVAAWIVERSPGRCPPTDFCPACGQGLACAIDAFCEPLAEMALVLSVDAVTSFWRYDQPSGDPTGKGYGVVRLYSPALADAILRRALAFWDQRDPMKAGSVVDSIWKAGYRDPTVTERRARRVVAAGREADLRIGLAMCEETLAHRDGNTSTAWNSLSVRARQIEAAIMRMETAEGSHHSTARMRRARPTRFLRQLPSG